MKAGGNKEVAGITEWVTGGSSFIILFYFTFMISYADIILTIQERERPGLDHCYNQGKKHTQDVPRS